MPGTRKRDPTTKSPASTNIVAAARVPPPLKAIAEGILRNPHGRKRGSLAPQRFALAIVIISVVDVSFP